jgi:hypothetical protein
VSEIDTKYDLPGPRYPGVLNQIFALADGDKTESTDMDAIDAAPEETGQ